MQDDLISVIVPVVNAEDYIDRCVESLVNQSYENIEIILVDNGSTDDSPIICDTWTQKDIRVKVIHKQNGSLASAKNAGLDYANGEYISFVSAKNFVDKEYLFTLLKNLEETHSDISICSMCCYYENEKLSDELVNDKENNDEVEIVTLVDDEDGEEVEEEENLEEDVENQEDSGDDDDSDDDETADEEYDEDDSSNETSNDNFNNDNKVDIEDDKTFNVNTNGIKLLEKKKSRSRLVFFEGDDIFDYFFSSVERIKTAPFGKLFRRKIFKKLRFDEDRIYEDEFLAHEIYLECKKFVRTSSQLYYYDVTVKPYKQAPLFVLKDLDKYYAMENRYNYFKDTKWQSQALNQMLVQIENIYCYAKAGKADSNTLKFLKHKFKLYYNESKWHKFRDKIFRHFPNLFYQCKRLTTKKM